MAHSAHERASFSLKLKEMIDLKTNEDDIHKEFRTPRLAKDENHVERIMSVIKGWVNPFDGPEELVCISSGVTVSPEIKQDLLGTERAGDTLVTEFFKDRIVSNNVTFFDPLPRHNLKTVKKPQNLKGLTVNLTLGLFKQCSRVQIFCVFVERMFIASSYILWNKFQDYQLRFISTNHFG